MDFYNEFLERLRNGDDANAIANEITKALNDSIKAKAEEDEKAKKNKLDEEIAARKKKVKIAQQDMEAYLDVMYDYVNDYLDAYADAHEKDEAETMSKDELKSLLDTWAQTHVWINKVSNMDLNDMLNELGSLWTDIDLGKKLDNWGTKVDTMVKIDNDDLDKVCGKTNVKVDLNDVEKVCNCGKSVKKPIKATTVHIKDDMSADEIINEFLKALG